MATRTLSQNVNQAISDFDSIKQAIIENGGEVPDGTPTSKYAELIEEISSDLSGYFDGTATAIKIPKNTTKIRESFFYVSDDITVATHSSVQRYNMSLTSVSMPDSITSIEKYAFHCCYGLAPISFPSSLTTIGEYAFYGCKSLTLISLPSNLDSIGDYAFAYCNSLTEVTFEGKPTSISTTAFKSFDNLKTIRVPWAEGKVSGAPWGASYATIVYNYTATE